MQAATSGHSSVTHPVGNAGNSPEWQDSATFENAMRGVT